MAHQYQVAQKHMGTKKEKKEKDFLLVSKVGVNVSGCETDMNYGGEQSSGRKLMTQPSLERQLSEREGVEGEGPARKCVHLNSHTRNHKRTMKSNTLKGDFGPSATRWIEVLRVLMMHSL